MRALRLAPLLALLAAACATGGASRGSKYGDTGFGPRPGGGGSGTVTTSAPVSGNGSAGTPVTIANGAIANASLANPLPSGTGIVKVTSGTGALATANVDYTGPNWFTQRLAEIRALDSTIDTMAFATECDQVTTSTTAGGPVLAGTAAGTGNAVQYLSESGGVFQFSTGTTANSTRVLQTNTAANNGKIVSNPKTTHWALTARVKITTTPDAQTGMKILDLSGGSFDHVFGVQGTATTGGSNANFSLWVSGPPNTFSTNVSQALILGTYFNITEVFDGTTLTGEINGVAVGTITDLTNFDTTAAFVRAFAQNGTTNANQEFHMDKWAAFTASPQ